jgi:hypothetical protein
MNEFFLYRVNIPSILAQIHSMNINIYSISLNFNKIVTSEIHMFTVCSVSIYSSFQSLNCFRGKTVGKKFTPNSRNLAKTRGTVLVNRTYMSS